MFNDQQIELIQHIGGGREAPDGAMTLSMSYCPANDIYWGNEDSTRCEQAIWCESRALSEWLYDEYPVATFSDYDPNFYPILTALAFNSANAIFAQARFMPASLTSSTLCAGWYPVLTLWRNGQSLPLTLTGWSYATLCQLTQQWLPWRAQAASPRVPFALSVGHRMLSMEKILALKAGDGIVLQSSAAISENQLWLYLQEKRIAMSVNENEIQVTSIQQDAEMASVADVLTDLTQLPVRVVAEVGVVHMSINDLAKVSPGMIFSTRAALSGEVRLTVNGACIGYASLIALNNVLVLRIESLMNASCIRPVLSSGTTEESNLEKGGDDGLAD
ncbi:MAG: FliM/FliN family flagellar motor switch protein [Kluyvera sp.]|uniref:FliM/FliN family flagellar motor switch protein n=1 Tax=Kluyvera sp. TaxID=1538228 RepID=UPI003F354DA6